jgi:hypothetical protein
MMPINLAIDLSNNTCRRDFLRSVFAFFLLARGKSCVAKTRASEYFYAVDLRDGRLITTGQTDIAPRIPPEIPPKIPHGPPGSIMKLVTAAAICEENLPARLQTVNCKGAIVVDGVRYACRAPHGKVNLLNAIGLSCNVFFGSSVKQISLSTLHNYVELFGLTATKELPPIGSPANPKVLDYALGLAKCTETDALRLLRVACAIAQKGKSLPFKNLVSEGDSLAPLRLDFGMETWRILEGGMHIAARRGTAKQLDPDNVLHVAAKTGTAIHGKTYQSWVLGYFPFEEPKFAFCLRAPAGTSYDQAVPKARQILFARTWI